MYHFWDIIIKPILTMIEPGVIVEIGSDRGENTVRLLEFCKGRDTVLHAVDPVPQFDVDALKNQYGRNFVFHKSLSLNAIPRIEGGDVFLIDGDHNWYTVFNELKLIEKCMYDVGKPFPVVMLHDTAWPYGRRDLYYNPETIPEKYRKPYKQKGMNPDSAELLDAGGLNRHLNNAIYENDLQSGVLTAIEDFLKDTRYSIEFINLPGLNGLGILVPGEMREHNQAVRTFLDTLDMDRLLADYIQTIEKIEIRKQLSLHDSIDQKDKRIQDIKGEWGESIQKLREERSLEIRTLREERSLEIRTLREERSLEIRTLREEQSHAMRKLREEKADEIKRLRDKQDREIQNLKNRYAREIEKRDHWIQEMSRDISELLRSKRWKAGVMLGELYRRMLFQAHVPTAADYIKKLIERTPAKQPAANQPPLPPSKKKARELKPRQALHFALVPEEQIPEEPVTVVIPVFNAFEDVEKCLESVIRYTPPPHNILLINDASTDSNIKPLLQRFDASSPRVTLITNAHNLGFTKTINIGCSRCSTDIVLLNSDTIVTPSWVDRLRESAYRRRNIGTVTPVSNNAGAFSVPEINRGNEIPAEYTLESYAALMAKLGIRHLPEVATGSGFCLYIKRSVLDAIGLFDEEHFPKGYGEENDFCLRAIKAGFRNVIDDGVYIYHRRMASFGDKKHQLSEQGKVQLRLLHPECDSLLKKFQEAHPLIYFSEAVRNALPLDVLLKHHEDSSEDSDQEAGVLCAHKQGTILFLIHDGGGGSVFTAWDLMKAIGRDFRSLLLVCGKSKWDLYDSQSNQKIYSFHFDIEWDPVEPIDPLRLSILKFVCREFDVAIAHARSLIGLSPEVFPFLKYLDIQVVFSFHDLYTLCPTIHLIDNKGVFCGGECSPGKGTCSIRNKWYRAIPNLKHGYIHEWRDRMGKNLVYCDSFITTAQAIKDIIGNHYPGTHKKAFSIIEHGRDIVNTGAKATSPDGKLIRVAAIGAGAAYKGALLLKGIIEANARHLKKNPDDIHFEFHLFGGSDGSLPSQLPGVIDHGPYQRHLLPVWLDAAKPSFSMIPSIVPESYCHTLTESWWYGMPVFGSDIGAIRERIRKYGGGWLLDYNDPKRWFEQMLIIARDTEEYQRKIQEIERMHFKTIEKMQEEYEEVYHRLLQAHPRKES